LAGEKNLNLSGEVFITCGAGRRLRVDPRPPTEEPRRNDTRVVEDKQFIAPKQPGEVGKVSILWISPRPRNKEKARSVAPIQWLLGDRAGRQVVVKVIQSHRV
jgi:hypothetical protein